MKSKDIAKSLPYPLNQGLRYLYGVIPFSIRYRGTFRETYNFLQKSQWWSKEQLEKYQLEQLSKLLHHAYENVPYYRRVFDERNLKPGDIQTLEDLQQLPYLTKQIVQNNIKDLKARNYPKSAFQYVTTGGSTGIPMGFYLEKDVSSAREWAFMLTQWNRVGFAIGDRCVVLRGKVIRSARKGRFWEYDPVNKWLILSSYHLTEENMHRYVERIRDFKPKFIQALPSTITILARFMKENDIDPFPSVEAVLCGSENLYPSQRKMLEEVLKCRVYSWYGHSEQAVLAGECEYSNFYHIFPEYGIVELIDENGKPVTKENKIGEIVATGLNNFIFPFIRYRTMDLAVQSNTKCECGRNYPLLKKVEGRLQEYILTKTGHLVPISILNMHSDVFDNVKQFQFYQEKQGEVIFNMVRRNTYTEKDTEHIQKEIYNKLGDDVDIIIRFVDHIARTRSGKYRFLIQKLQIEFGDVEVS